MIFMIWLTQSTVHSSTIAASNLSKIKYGYKPKHLKVLFSQLLLLLNNIRIASVNDDY